MVIKTADDASHIAIEWAKGNFSVTDATVTSSTKIGTNWRVAVKFIKNNEEKRYVLMVKEDETIGGFKEHNNYNNSNNYLNTASTYITVSLVFSIIALIVYIYYIFSLVFAIVAISSLSSTSSVPASFLYAISIIPFIIALLFLIVDIFMLIRINRIKKYIDSGNVLQAYKANSVLFGILGLIFGMIITGIFLLLARSPLNTAKNDEF